MSCDVDISEKRQKKMMSPAAHQIFISPSAPVTVTPAAKTSPPLHLFINVGVSRCKCMFVGGDNVFV